MENKLESKKLSWLDTDGLNITTKLFTVGKEVEVGAYNLNNEDVGKFLVDVQFDIWKQSNNIRDEICHLADSMKAGNISANDAVYILKRVGTKLDTFTL